MVYQVAGGGDTGHLGQRRERIEIEMKRRGRARGSEGGGNRVRVLGRGTASMGGTEMVSAGEATQREERPWWRGRNNEEREEA